MNLPLENGSKPRDQHFVPKCYLRNFITDKTLFTLDIRKVLLGYKISPKPDYPKRICYIKNYYTLPQEYNEASFNFDDYDKYIIEKEILNKLENRYSKLFPKLISEDSILLNEAIELCDFIVQLKFRNPMFLMMSESAKEERIQKIGQDILINDLNKNPRWDCMPMELKIMVLRMVQNAVLQDSNWSKQMQLMGLIKRNPNVGNLRSNLLFRKAILNCKWTILGANEGENSFLTSDNPGFSLGADGLVYSSKFTGGFEFYFPLSPKYCLLISDKDLDHAFDNSHIDKKLEFKQLKNSEIERINENAIVNINKIIIASNITILNYFKEKLTGPEFHFFNQL